MRKIVCPDCKNSLVDFPNIPGCPFCGWIEGQPEEPTMTDMSIKEAIRIRRKWHSTKSGDDPGSTAVERIEAEQVILRVAEAWVKLERELHDAGDPEGDSYADAAVIWCSRMNELLNPTPKSDIERVREWAQERWNWWTDRQKLMDFLDQLEKEKKA